MAKNIKLQKAIKEIYNTENLINKLKAQIQDLESSRANSIEIIKQECKRNDNKLVTPDLSFTFVPEHTQQRVDTTTFKNNYKEIYERCLKTSTVNESLRIKLLQ